LVTLASPPWLNFEDALALAQLPVGLRSREVEPPLEAMCTSLFPRSVKPDIWEAWACKRLFDEAILELKDAVMDPVTTVLPLLSSICAKKRDSFGAAAGAFFRFQNWFFSAFSFFLPLLVFPFFALFTPFRTGTTFSLSAPQDLFHIALGFEVDLSSI